ncbi:Pheophytinase, chloroplastic [Porphyridium purpureum]|uniref:Pheophytinase, chloroplastic n=1 Tax=Porphyridium purpureum TaxID=35688 RepID=A0A5J4YJR5_PORPP|nr:Pheophytinase, chloroplastic [Porphyridium purpureum]|eukprot:POR4682..scf210_14
MAFVSAVGALCPPRRGEIARTRQVVIAVRALRRLCACMQVDAAAGSNSGSSSGVQAEAVSSGPAQVEEKVWIHRGLKVGYTVAGSANHNAPAILCVHGFGASAGHWRKTLPDLGTHFRVYAICLLGFGRSEKVAPGSLDADGVPLHYTFDTWSRQLREFCDEVIRSPGVALVANSIGAVAALQAAVDASKEDREDMFAGLVQLDTSLRLLHVRKRSWLANIGAPILMWMLMRPGIGQLFFNQIQQDRTLRNIMCKAYAVHDAVDDELLRILQAPARDPGALGVFLAFTSYDTGPLPEDLIPQLRIPTLLIWGKLDTFEPIALGRPLAELSDQVVGFVELEGVGHCPMDEAPERSVPLIRKIKRGKLPLKFYFVATNLYVFSWPASVHFKDRMPCTFGAASWTDPTCSATQVLCLARTALRYATCERQGCAVTDGIQT